MGEVPERRRWSEKKITNNAGDIYATQLDYITDSTACRIPVASVFRTPSPVSVPGRTDWAWYRRRVSVVSSPRTPGQTIKTQEPRSSFHRKDTIHDLT